MLIRILQCVLVLGLLTQVMAKENNSEPVLEFERLDLTDGRKLKNVVVKNYDAEKDRLLLVANGKAMTISVELVPEPFRTRLKEHAPSAGSSTSSIPPKRHRPPTANPEPQPVPPSAPTRPVQPTIDPAQHRASAVDRADRYYRFEHQAGAATLSLRDVAYETDDPEPVTGWPNRYRVQGRAFLEYYETKNYTTIRSTDRFEVLTEQKDGGSIRVIDFTRKQ